MISLKSQAINTALLGDWEAAIRLNKDLLKEDPEDIDALNRLGYAYCALGKTKEAKTTYNKVLKFDDQNQIALRNLARIKGDMGNQNTQNTNAIISSNPDMFLEETGKTKIVELINIAEPKTIIHLRIGETVDLVIKRSKIFVLDTNKKFVGMLPDNIGKRLIKFLTGGNQYDACIKSINHHKVLIFIRERKRVTRFKNQPTFLLVSEKNPFVLEKSDSKADARRAHVQLDSEDDSD